MAAAMNAVLLCSVLLTLPTRGSYSEALCVCLEVANAAEDAGEPPALLVALAYVESRLDRAAISPAGARGPLQVMPQYWKGDPIVAGVVAWRHWRSKATTDRQGLAMYNAGRNPGPRAYRHADRVLSIFRMLGGK